MAFRERISAHGSPRAVLCGRLSGALRCRRVPAMCPVHLAELNLGRGGTLPSAWRAVMLAFTPLPIRSDQPSGVPHQVLEFGRR